MNFYNEHNPFAAAWIRELIKAGHIPDGVVDERDIQEIDGDELDGYTQVHLFCGIAGWPLALDLAGWPRDRPVWTGSCPCQPFSVGGDRKGKADPRHAWPDMLRLIAKCRPDACFGEQVASDDGCEWLAGVFTDLEALEYRVAGADLCAAGVGAPHLRQRLFWVADALPFREPRLEPARHSRPPGPGWASGAEIVQSLAVDPFAHGAGWPQPVLRALDDGVSCRVGGVSGAGNAIVPQVAAQFVRAYMECI